MQIPVILSMGNVYFEIHWMVNLVACGGHTSVQDDKCVISDFKPVPFPLNERPKDLE